MTQLTVIKRARRAGESCKATQARHVAMEAVAAPVRNAGALSDRLAMAQHLVRYAAVVLAHQCDPSQAGSFVASVAGELMVGNEKGRVA